MLGVGREDEIMRGGVGMVVLVLLLLRYNHHVSWTSEHQHMAAVRYARIKLVKLHVHR